MALYFNECESVEMEHVHVVDSPGASGVIIYNTVGVNNFTQCNFSGNTFSNDPSAYPGGGGVYIEFSYCLPGYNSCANATLDSYTDRNKESTYLFTECTFAHNQAFTDTTGVATPIYIVPYRRNHVAFGRGGGLSVFFNANANSNHFSILNCSFTKNTAKYGAGMLVAFQDTSGNNTITVDGGTKFESNRCDRVAGGGMRVAHLVYREGAVKGKRNRVEIRNSMFFDNSALNGGGLSLSSARQYADKSQLFSVLVQNTRFEQNRGSYGSALRVDLYSLIVTGRKPNITLVDCTFLNNTVYLPTYTGPREIGVGAMYVNQIDVHFRGDTTFALNNGSALALVAASMDFMNSTTAFYENTGINGGAIALLGSSRILINQTSILGFLGNTANEGGAIYNKYTDRNDYHGTRPQCFIAHHDPFISPDHWNAIFQFNVNRDSVGNNAIYTTSIFPCSFAGGIGQANISKIFCWNNWTYDSDNCSSFIRTGPGKITHRRTIPYSPLSATATNRSIHIPAYSGQIIPLHLHAVDDLNHTIPVVYTATVINSTSPNYTGAKVDPAYSYVSQNKLKVLQYQRNGTNATIYLDTVGDRSWRIELNITLLECPPGLLPTPTACNGTDSNKSCIVCECREVANYKDYVRCNAASNASLTGGYWMGLLPGEECYNETCVVAAQCPPGFCRTDGTEFIALPHSGLNEHICGPQNRTGEVCGECAEGYGPALNSETYDCVICNVSTHHLALHATYYVLAVYVPLFLLFLALIVFKIKLTTGSANAFILYSQVISSTFDIDGDAKIPLSSVIPNVRSYLIAYKFPYGIFNLEFFETFIPSKYLCLGTGLNVLDIMLLDYIVAFFPLLMIIAVLLVYKVRNSCGRCVRRSLVRSGYIQLRFKIGSVSDALLPAFASFILLSYTKFSLTSSYISVTESLYDAGGNAVGRDRVYYAGHYSVDDTKYVLFYRIPSILIFLTFVAIPPLLLLDYPLKLCEKWIFHKLPWFKYHYPQGKIHIILDTFQGCYKNKWRCFAGLYFVFRLVINVTYIYSNTLLQFALQGIYCMVFSLLVAYFKPYKKEFHLFNYVDSMIFLNLGIINQISFYLYAHTRTGSSLPVSAFAVQYILVFLPLVYMVAYIVWSLLPIPRARDRVKAWLANRQQPQQLENPIQSRTSATPELGADVDWERAQEVNRYSPVTPTTGEDCDAPPSTGSMAAGTGDDSGVSSEDKPSRRSYGSTGESTTNVTFHSSLTEEDN